MPIVKDMQLELENDIEECFKSFKQSNDNTKNTFNVSITTKNIWKKCVISMIYYVKYYPFFNTLGINEGGS